jgi:hypothetical protein
LPVVALVVTGFAVAVTMVLLLAGLLIEKGEVAVVA